MLKTLGLEGCSVLERTKRELFYCLHKNKKIKPCLVHAIQHFYIYNDLNYLNRLIINIVYSFTLPCSKESLTQLKKKLPFLLQLYKKALLNAYSYFTKSLHL